MKKFKKLVALGTVMTLFVSPVAVFADGQKVEPDKQVIDSMTEVPAPMPMEQRELTKRDLVAVEYAQTKIKEYFSYEMNKDEFFIDVFYSSDYNDEQYPKENSFRDNISVSFMPKDENVMGGAYISYYEDDKEIMSASVMNIDYEAKKTISKEKGLELAKKFLKEKVKLNLSDFKYKNFDDMQDYQDYMMADYYFQRMEQGIEVDVDFASASVDLSTGKIVSFYKNITTGVKYPSAKAEINANEALAIVKGSFTTDLRYMVSPDNENKVIPVYFIDTVLGEAVDAHTKELYNMGAPLKIDKYNKTDDEVKALIKDIKPIDLKAQNKGQAVEVANKLIKAMYGVELKPLVEDMGYDPNNIYITYKDNKNKMEYYVSLNLSGKKAVFAGRMPMYIEGMEETYSQNNGTPTISYKEAYDIAIKQLGMVMTPEEIKLINFEQQNYIYEPNQGNQVEYYFNFSRNVNGLLFPDEYVDVRINGVTKEVESMSLFWDNARTFDSTDKIIKPADAMTKFLNDKTMELRYTIDFNETQKTGNTVIKLIYIMVPKNGEYKGNNIDAKTGEYIEYPMMYGENY